MALATARAVDASFPIVRKVVAVVVVCSSSSRSRSKGGVCVCVCSKRRIDYWNVLFVQLFLERISQDGVERGIPTVALCCTSREL